MFQPLEEPMQVDASPEENENVKDGHTIVENTTLVSGKWEEREVMLNKYELIHF